MINGIYAATLSVLDKNLALNSEKTIKYAENLIDKGCHGVVFFGSTGQSQLISLSEKIQLINLLPKSNYRDKFIIGTGRQEYRSCCPLGVKPAFRKRPAGPLTDPACRSPDRGS